MRAFADIVIEKLIEKLNDRMEHLDSRHKLLTDAGLFKESDKIADKMVEVDFIKQIVNQLAEEYKGGWIPYATGAELPLNNQKVWLSFTSQYASFVKSAWWVNDHFEWSNGHKVKDVPLAWKPYNVPAPYQPEGE